MLLACAGGCPKKPPAEHGVHFRPGLNENLAATSIMGTQIFEVAGKSEVDGERVPAWSAAVIFRRANLAEAGKNCAAMAGDDHGRKSSSTSAWVRTQGVTRDRGYLQIDRP
jgi:indolepyruvate ferredoxin oxidoreductase